MHDVSSAHPKSPAAPAARFAARVCTGVLALVTAGCGDDGPASFVGRASNAVVYVTWTRSGDSLSGQLTQSHATKRTTTAGS